MVAVRNSSVAVEFVTLTNELKICNTEISIEKTEVTAFHDK
jgi:hypothetical protein